MTSVPEISFEIFPPKTAEGDAALLETLDRLESARPAFLSVTYGADGSGQERSLHAIERLAKRKTPLAAHLTCVGATREQVDGLASKWHDMGVRRIVALRGDMPGGGPWQPYPGGYARASELVAGLTRLGGFDLAVSAYPETHPDSPSEKADLENLKAKQDAGAASAITQYCFDTETVLRFRDRTRQIGVTLPITVGVMPITNFASIAKFSARCGAGIPDWLADRFEGLDPNGEAAFDAAVSVAADQCQALLREGFDSFHFYTLNRAPLSLAICRALGAGNNKAEAA